MSGRSIGSIIGGAIGYVVGGVSGLQYGMQIGGIAGGLLMPDEVGLQDQTGPRLQDLKTTTSTYGAHIPKVYGSYRIGGNIIWATDIKETKHVEEVEVGKGGSETYDVITYSYAIDIAIGICEGPIGGILKIWGDSVLIYDANAGGFTSAVMTQEYASGETSIYLGSDDQQPNWLLQSNNPDSPAYRGLAYVVLQDFQLELFGNRIPNFTFEVVNGESGDFKILSRGSTYSKIGYGYDLSDVAYTKYAGPISTNMPLSCKINANPNDDHDSVYSYMFYGNGNNGYVRSSEKLNDTRSYAAQGNLWLDKAGYFFKTGGTYTSGDSWVYFDDGGIERIHGYGTANCWLAHFIHKETPAIYKNNILYMNYDGKFRVFHSPQTYLAGSTGGVDDYECWAYSNDKVCGGIDLNNKCEDISTFTLTGNFDDDSSNDYLIHLGGKLILHFAISDNQIVMYSLVSTYVFDLFYYDLETGGLLKEERHTSQVDIDLTGQTKGYANLLMPYGDDDVWMIMPSASSGKIDINRIKNGVYYYIGKTEDSINLAGTDTSYNEVFVGDNNHTIYNIINGLLYYTGLNTSSHTCYAIFSLTSANSESVTLSFVVEHLLQESNVSLSEMDLSEGETTYVTGFVRSNTSSARANISILQSIYLFDLVEEDFIIVLKMRGRNKVLDLIEDDLLDENIVTNTLETELPKSVEILYNDVEKDYQVGSQSTIRIDSISDNNASIEVPITLSPDEAKQLTEKLMYSTWSGRYNFSFKIPLSNLKVADVITLQLNGITYLIRVISITIETNNTLSVGAVSEHTTSYSSSAIGSSVSDGTDPNDLLVYGDSQLRVFNAPTLLNTYINANIVYLTASSYYSGWKGCSYVKSKDDGLTYEYIGAQTTPAIIGTVTSTLPIASITVWDLTSTITVNVIGSLITLTTEQTLNGNNYVLIGNEVLQYTIATEVSTGTYELTELLRGRLGTEQFVDIHVANEDFVFLGSVNNTAPIEVNFSTYNVERLYKAVTFGTLESDAYSKALTYDGTNLTPFSPSCLNISRNDQITTITWARRDRFISGYFNPLPLSEITELYTVYVYDYGNNYINQYQTTSQTFQYDRDVEGIIDGIQNDENLIFAVSQTGDVFDGYKTDEINDFISSQYFEELFDYTDPTNIEDGSEFTVILRNTDDAMTNKEAKYTVNDGDNTMYVAFNHPTSVYSATLLWGYELLYFKSVVKYSDFELNLTLNIGKDIQNYFYPTQPLLNISGRGLIAGDYIINYAINNGGYTQAMCWIGSSVKDTRNSNVITSTEITVKIKQESGIVYFYDNFPSGGATGVSLVWSGGNLTTSYDISMFVHDDTTYGTTKDQSWFRNFYGYL